MMRNLLTPYGQVTLSNYIDYGNTYVTTQTRNAQNNDMLYYFLVDSLEAKFRAKVLLYADSYSAHNVVVASALLKQIIILTRIDNPAAATHVRELVIKSKKQLLKLMGTITEFKSWVRQQVNKLHARDQKDVDLTNYLWKAYKAAPDEDFITYIKDKKSQVYYGRVTYTAEDLMTLAENKYDARLLDEDNSWGTPSDEQEQILAMTAEIKVLKQGNNKGSNSNKKGKKRFSKNKSNEDSGDKSNKDTKKKKKPMTSGYGRK